MTDKSVIGMISRVQSALDGIPMGHDSTGTKTISPNGMYAFQRDMREFKQMFRWFCWALLDEQFSEAEKHVKSIEKFSADCKRKLR